MKPGLTTGIAALVASLAMPIAASAYTVNGWQYVFDFETPSDVSGLPSSTGLQTDFLCDCSITNGTADYPAVSQTHVLSVGSGSQTGDYQFEILVADPVNISWAAFGAFVTGGAAVTADFYAYNYGSQTEEFAGEAATAGPNDAASGGTPNAYLSFIDETNLTEAVFSSTKPFTLDDVALGLPDVGPGIPEPTSWALFLVGFGGLGLVLRAGRGAAARADA